ncbi:MAG: hypothetical protein QM820_01990 [Minicystis sp.]
MLRPSSRPEAAGRRALRFAVAAAVVLAAVTQPEAARADTTAEQRAAAQVLFDDARRLMADKRFTEACPKLEESQRIDPGIGTLLNLAECQLQIGKTASAWANFLEAAYQAKAAGQAKREATARAKAAAIEPRLSRLTVSAAPGVEVRRNGFLIAASTLGTPLPVDPGEHVIVASAPGKKSWVSRIVVKDNGDRVTVGVPTLDPGDSASPPLPAPSPAPPAPAPPASNPADVTPPASPPPAPPSEPPATGAPARRIGGIALLVAGAGGLITGAAFAAMAKSKYDESLGQCDPMKPNECYAGGARLRDEARRNGDISTVAFIAGGTVAAGGLALLISSLQSKPAARAGAVTWTAGIDPRGGAAFGLKGSF